MAVDNHGVALILPGLRGKWLSTPDLIRGRETMGAGDNAGVYGFPHPLRVGGSSHCLCVADAFSL
jgi:hypothetical protein